jgi:hypothetical protein
MSPGFFFIPTTSIKRKLIHNEIPDGRAKSYIHTQGTTTSTPQQNQKSSRLVHQNWSVTPTAVQFWWRKQVVRGGYVS